MPLSTINDIIGSLKGEDKIIFSVLAGHGYNLEREDFKLHWVSYESGRRETFGACDDDEEVIRNARVIYQDIVKAQVSAVVSTPEVEAEARLSTDAVDAAAAALRHKREAHELDLLNRRADELKAEGHAVTRYPESQTGVADLYSSGALVVYQFKCTTDAALLTEALSEVAAARDYLNPHARAVVVSCCIEDIEALRDAAQEAGAVEVLFSPNTGVLAVTAVAVKLPEEPPTPDEEPAVNPAEQHGILFPSQPAPPLTQEMLSSKMTRHPSLLMRDGGLDEKYVEELTEFLKAGGEFEDPVDLFYDDAEGKYWVADGNNRHEASLRAGDKPLAIRLHYGTLRAAVEFAFGANARHGRRQSDNDKRLKVVGMLSDPAWYKLSDSELARMSRGAVTQQFVSKVRRALKVLVPELIADKDFERGNVTLAAVLQIPEPLVRIVRDLPADEQDSLFQNILADAEPAEEGDAEEEAPLFHETETATSPDETLAPAQTDIAVEEPDEAAEEAVEEAAAPAERPHVAREEPTAAETAPTAPPARQAKPEAERAPKPQPPTQETGAALVEDPEGWSELGVIINLSIKPGKSLKRGITVSGRAGEGKPIFLTNFTAADLAPMPPAISSLISQLRDAYAQTSSKAVTARKAAATKAAKAAAKKPSAKGKKSGARAAAK